MTTQFRISIQLVALAATVSMATAQTRPYFDPSEPSDLAWPAQWGPPGTFTRTAVGEFMGDGMRDVVTLAGTMPVLLANAAYYDWQHALPVVANDLDVATGAGLLGRDAVAVVNQTGLQLVYLNSTTPAGWVVETVDTLGWKNASKVRCGHIDLASPIDYFGIAFDATDLVRRLGGAATGELFHTGQAVADLTFVQWDADPSLEIALMYADGVDIFNSDGPQFATPLASFQLGATISMTAVAPSTNVQGGLGGIAVLHTNAGVKSLTTLSPTNPVSSTIVLPATMTYFSVASGDVDADGDGDLVFTDARVFAPIFLQNQSPAVPSFAAPASWSAQLVVDHHVLLDVPAAGNVALPQFADLTDDGLADLFLPLPRTIDDPFEPMPAHLYLEALPLQSQLQTLPAFFHGGFVSDVIGADERHAVLRIDTNQIASLTSGTATGVEVSVWRESAFGAPINTGFVYHFVHSFENHDWTNADTLGIEIDFNDPDPCFHNLYWIQVTPVIHQTNSSALTIAYSWHPFFGALALFDEDVCGSLSGNGEPRGWLDGPAVGGLTELDPCEDNYTCKSFGTTPAGAVVGRRRLPQLTASTIASDANAPHVLATASHTIDY